MGSPTRRSAFTLTELLVVISIIAVLAALLLPALASAKATGQRTFCQSNLRQLGMAFAGYTADSSGALPWSWNNNQDNNFYRTPNTQCLPYPGYFQQTALSIAGTGLPVSPTSGFPYDGSEFGWSYYPYLNNASVFTCPTQFQLQNRGGLANPAAIYVVAPSNTTALIYNSYRQNPYFGHTGWTAGNMSEYSGISPWTVDYKISGRLNVIHQPEATVLNFDASPWRFLYPGVPSPACANNSGQYVPIVAGDRTFAPNYSTPPYTYCPNIGFIHGTAGNATRYIGDFSYVDGHVATLTSDILADFTDYVFLLKK